VRLVDRLFPFYEKILMIFATAIHICYPPVKRSHREPLYSWIMRCNRVYAVTYMFIFGELSDYYDWNAVIRIGACEYRTRRMNGLLRQIFAKTRAYNKTKRILDEHRDRYLLFF